MANQRGKQIDKTYLSIDTAEDRGFIHRDYIAHCMRWSHVVKYLYQKKNYETARILDIGCGREIPLAKMLYSSKLSPEIYYGIDAGPILDEEVAKISKTGVFRHELWENHNFLDLKQEDLEKKPNVVVSFEVLEHVEPKMMLDMLEHMKKLTSDDCTYFISTPNWNRVDCAANHVNEMLYEALGAAFERHGFVIENVWGTFASIRDYEHLLDKLPLATEGTAAISRCFNKLREYYDTNFLSCIFAPLFPAQSRNCLWQLRKLAGKGTGFNYPIPKDYPRFKVIQEIQKPWSSSQKWEEMAL